MISTTRIVHGNPVVRAVTFKFTSSPFRAASVAIDMPKESLAAPPTFVPSPSGFSSRRKQCSVGELHSARRNLVCAAAKPRQCMRDSHSKMALLPA